MKYYVYIWTNTKNGKQYVGKGCAGRAFHHFKGCDSEVSKAMRREGRTHFALSFATTAVGEEEALYVEALKIKELRTLHPRGYNLHAPDVPRYVPAVPAPPELTPAQRIRACEWAGRQVFGWLCSQDDGPALHVVSILEVAKNVADMMCVKIRIVTGGDRSPSVEFSTIDGAREVFRISDAEWCCCRAGEWAEYYGKVRDATYAALESLKLVPEVSPELNWSMFDDE